MSVNPKLISWVTSASGFDGGRLNANIWVAGIEWGFKGDISKYYANDLPREINNGHIPDLNKPLPWEPQLQHSYDQNLAKLICAIYGHPVENYKSIGQIPNSDIFKLNLFPIAFKSVNEANWQKHNLSEITGFQKKYLFNIWCQVNRFKFISELLKKQTPPPKLILCTGITYVPEFFTCFASEIGVTDEICEEQISSENVEYAKPSTLCWAKLNNGGYLVVVRHFSGPRGLKGNALLTAVGKRIGEICSLQNLAKIAA